METEEHIHGELSFEICRDNFLNYYMRTVSRDVKLLLDIESGLADRNGSESLLSESTRVERNVVFLWCAFLKKCHMLVSVERLGVDVNFSLPAEGLSALRSFSGCVKCCDWLIQNNCDINSTPENLSPLHCAVLGNSPETTKLLLKHGADLKDTVLHSAVRVNAVDCLILLINRNVDINAFDEYGMAPLHIAVDKRIEHCLKAFLECSKIDIDLKTKHKRNTALYLASHRNYADCVAMLINKNASIDKRNAKLQTPLHLAAKRQGVECVVLLLRAGANVDAAGIDHITPIHEAVGKALLATKTIEILIECGADVNVQDTFGLTPLHVAALNELPQCVDYSDYERC